MQTSNASSARKLRPNFYYGLLCILFSLALSACGGGGGGGGGIGGGGGGGSLAGGIGGTGSVAAIASITVNGVKYSCSSTTFEDDDGPFTPSGSRDPCVEAEAAGRISSGSVVTVVGTTDNAGNATATSINISRSVRGPVANLNVTGQSFKVLGQTVLVDQNTKPSGIAMLSVLHDGDIVEVSGFRQPTNAVLPNGAVLATLVKTVSVTNGESELKGFANVTGGSVTINGVAIANVSPLPTNGQCVEAKGTFSGNTLTLTHALKSDDDCTGGSALGGSLTQAQVEGVITAFSTVSNFTVGGQAINGSSASILGGLTTDLLNGVKVEIKGTLSSGVLNATQIEIKSNGVRIKATADGTYNTGTGIVSVLGIAVKVGTATELSGDPLNAIATGTRVEIEGSKSGSGTMNASKFKVITGGGGNNSPELRGPLDAKPVVGSFSILGVPVTTSGSTVFQNLSGVSNEATFVANTNANDIVKVKGTEIPNNQISATDVENED